MRIPGGPNRGWTVIPLESLDELVGFALHLKDLDGLVRGAGGQTMTVIVHLDIMLGVRERERDSVQQQQQQQQQQGGGGGRRLLDLQSCPHAGNRIWLSWKPSLFRVTPKIGKKRSWISQERWRSPNGGERRRTTRRRRKKRRRKEEVRLMAGKWRFQNSIFFSFFFLFFFLHIFFLSFFWFFIFFHCRIDVKCLI